MLSQLYAHLPANDDARWTKIHGRETCDECLAVQHETHGSARRQPARWTRHDPVGVLRLCAVHAEDWKTKDRGE